MEGFKLYTFIKKTPQLLLKDECKVHAYESKMDLTN